jgi:hypothetical protein
MSEQTVTSTDLEPVSPDRKGEDREAAAVVRAAVDAVSRTGRFSASAVASAVEGAARALARRVIASALRDPNRVAAEDVLADELAAPVQPPAAVSKATVVLLAARFARRFGPLRAVFARTPTWMLAAAIPALYASVVHGAGELRLVASHLVLRARAAGFEPDPDRVRRIAVQVLRGDPIDPIAEPRHGPLAVRWLRRAGWAALPFTKGVSTRDPDGMAAVAASVPPSLLRA